MSTRHNLLIDFIEQHIEFISFTLLLDSEYSEKCRFYSSDLNRTIYIPINPYAPLYNEHMGSAIDFVFEFLKLNNSNLKEMYLLNDRYSTYVIDHKIINPWLIKNKWKLKETHIHYWVYQLIKTDITHEIMILTTNVKKENPFYKWITLQYIYKKTILELIKEIDECFINEIKKIKI